MRIILLYRILSSWTLTSATLQVLLLDEQMKELARRLMNDGSLLLFGRGYNYATALEAALKVKEVALMHRHALMGIHSVFNITH